MNPKKINDVNIHISRAEVTSVSIGLEDGEWKMSISGNLVSDTGHVVTTFSYSTESWNDRSKFELPIEVPGMGRRLFELATPVVIKKIQGHFSALESGE